MKVYTVMGPSSFLGARVDKLLYSEDYALTVGSIDNGCKLGVVKLTTRPESLEVKACQIIAENGKYLVQPTKYNSDENLCLVVFRTHVYKGGRNIHTGDRKNCSCYKCQLEFDIKQEDCSNCGGKLKVYFQEFPAQILAKGTVRDSKKAVFGSQLVCILKKNAVVRTAYDGYTFGKPGCHYHWFDGGKLITCTWEERLRIYGL